MKKFAPLLMCSALLLTACGSNEELVEKEQQQEQILSKEDQFLNELEDVFELKEVAKIKDIALIPTGDGLEGSWDEEDKILLLANNTNLFSIMEVESFIASTLANDYKSLENPTKTFEWVLKSDKELISYIEQMEFDELPRKLRKIYEEAMVKAIEAVEIRDEIVQAWLDLTQGKPASMTLEDVKLNLSDQSIYALSLGLGIGLGATYTEGIGSYDVSHFTKYGYEQMSYLNSITKKMLLDYYIAYNVKLDFHGESDMTNTTTEQATTVVENVTPTVTDTYLDEQIEGVIANYLNTYASGDTMSLAYYVDIDSAFYEEQLSYMASLNDRGVMLYLLNHSIDSINYVNDTTYKVTVYETYGIDHPENQYKEVSQTAIYTVEQIAGEWMITALSL